MTRYEGVPIHIDFVDNAELRMMTMLAPPIERLQPTLAKACLTSGAAVEQHRGATLKKACTPLGQTLNRKTASKRSHVNSALKSVSSDQSLAELAKSLNKIRLAQIEMKHQKMQFASDERTLALQKQMQDRDLQYKEQLLQHELALARLKAGKALDVGQGGYLTNTYSSSTDIDNFSQDLFSFGTGAMSTFPSLPPTDWGIPNASAP